VTATIDVQFATECRDIPDRKTIRKWAKSCLKGLNTDVEFTVRIVDEPEMLALNSTWRGQNKTTNVLSFPAGDNAVMPELLGDIVICAPVIYREAVEQDKQPEAHWAHMLIHGILHLLGYDHENEVDAQVMEILETEKLELLNYPDPYN